MYAELYGFAINYRAEKIATLIQSKLQTREQSAFAKSRFLRELRAQFAFVKLLKSIGRVAQLVEQRTENRKRAAVHQIRKTPFHSRKYGVFCTLVALAETLYKLV